GLGKTFPHTVDGGESAPGGKFHSAFNVSPFASELIAEFVQAALREEKLGRGDATDLLAIGFSQFDAAGHSYGPDSHEVMDTMLRLDRIIADLLDTLDREIG